MRIVRKSFIVCDHSTQLESLMVGLMVGQRFPKCLEQSFPVFAEGLCSHVWACHPHLNTYWVGPEVHLDFSLRCDRNIWTNFLASSIVSNSSLYFLLSKTVSSAQGESLGPSQVFLKHSQSPGDAHTPIRVLSLPDFQKSELSKALYVQHMSKTSF